MIIISFDCAIKNLGICCIDYDEKWQDKLTNIYNELINLYEELDKIDIINKDNMVNNIKNIVLKLDYVLNNIIKIIWCNVIDLIPDKKVYNNPIEQSKKLKYILNNLDEQLPLPDLVLIEHQMKINDITRTMSNQIIYHYMDPGNNDISFGIKEYSFNLKNNLTNKLSPDKIKLVGPALKNTIKLYKQGGYENFIVKYANNYTANKNHCDNNFKQFIRLFYPLLKLPKKTNDIADAFMMAFAYIFTYLV